MYAGRKRRKPVQRSTKLVPVEGAKSNPSKRHRERLNAELERLAGLLPFQQDVISRLDKLSILRLSVSFLRAKSFFHALKSNSGDRIKDASGTSDMVLPEGELLLQALNGFVLVVTSEGLVFYSSHTIQDYLGFHQSDVINQSVFELIHTEDRSEFQRQLHWAFNPPGGQESATDTHAETPSCSFLVTYNPEQLPPENSSFLERNFVARFRCLLDNSSGFMALHFQGRLKFLHGQNRKAADGTQVPSQLALFAVATPLQPPAILEIRTKNMIFRTKHKLDFTPLGCDAKGRVVLGYTEIELCMRGTGYQFIHAADMLHCAENHVRMMRTGESGLTVFRLLTKDKGWTWVQANARLVYKNGRPDYIIATQRPLSDEEGAEQLRKRSLHLPFTYATGEAVLYECSFALPPSLDPMQPKGHGGGGRGKKGLGSKGAAGGSGARGSLDPDSLLGAMLRQDESVYVCPPDPVPKFSFSKSYFSELGGMGSLDIADQLSRGRAVDRATITEDSSADMKPDINTALMLTHELPDFGQQSCSTMAGPGLVLGGEGDSDDGAGGDLLSALQCFGISVDELDVFEQDERLVMLELDSLSAQLNETISNMDILDYVDDSLSRRTGQFSQGELLAKPESSLSCPTSSQSLAYMQPQVTNQQQPQQQQQPHPQPQQQQQQPPAKQAQQQMFYQPKINRRYTSWDEQQQHAAMQQHPQTSHQRQRQRLQLMQHQAGAPIVNGQIQQHTQQQQAMQSYQFTPLDDGGEQYNVEAATAASYTQSFPACQQMQLNSRVAVDSSSYSRLGFSSSSNGAAQAGEGQCRTAAAGSSICGYATQLQQFVPSKMPAAQSFMLKQNFNLLSSCQYQSQQCPATVMKEQLTGEVSERQQQQLQQLQQQQQEEDLMMSCSGISCTVEQERQYKLPMDRNIGNGNVLYEGVNCEQLSSFPDGETLPVHPGMSQPMPDAMQYFLDS
ncbi:unnamed protein product [Lampetra planeri]